MKSGVWGDLPGIICKVRSEGGQGQNSGQPPANKKRGCLVVTEKELRVRKRTNAGGGREKRSSQSKVNLRVKFA